MDDADLHRRVAALPALVNDDAWLVARGRFVSLDWQVEIGAVPYWVAVERGRIAAIEPGPLLLRSYCFAIRGPAEAWRQFWRPVPPPYHHDIFALQKRSLLRIEGDLHPLMANLLYFKDVLAAPRRVAP